MKKLLLRDRTGERPEITGASAANMIRRMYGSTARGPAEPTLSEPFTVTKTGGMVIGTAIIHDISNR